MSKGGGVVCPGGNVFRGVVCQGGGSHPQLCTECQTPVKTLPSQICYAMRSVKIIFSDIFWNHALLFIDGNYIFNK